MPFIEIAVPKETLMAGTQIAIPVPGASKEEQDAFFTALMHSGLDQANVIAHLSAAGVQVYDSAEREAKMRQSLTVKGKTPAEIDEYVALPGFVKMMKHKHNLFYVGCCGIDFQIKLVLLRAITHSIKLEFFIASNKSHKLNSLLPRVIKKVKETKARPLRFSVCVSRCQNLVRMMRFEDQ